MFIGCSFHKIPVRIFFGLFDLCHDCICNYSKAFDCRATETGDKGLEWGRKSLELIADSCWLNGGSSGGNIDVGSGGGRNVVEIVVQEVEMENRTEDTQTDSWFHRAV